MGRSRRDEWSDTIFADTQGFSKQSVARPAPAAGFGKIPFPELLVKLQEAMKEGDRRAEQIYEMIGTCFGDWIAHHADFYDIENLAILGRMTPAKGNRRSSTKRKPCSPTSSRICASSSRSQTKTPSAMVRRSPPPPASPRLFQ
jgi:hypothetical protein